MKHRHIATALVDWFSHVREDYFFRQNRTPYRVWISEVALQQTRIQAALPILQDFLEKFPDVNRLAVASEDEVLTAFKGLGYYNRARNLRKGAIYLVENHSAALPNNHAELLQVPSIGGYTAAAVASICFGQRVAVLDGNVKRVLSRILTLEDKTNEPIFAQRCHAFLKPLVEKAEEHPGDINEALMELGQKVCLRSNPACDRCPILAHCAAAEKGRQQDFPRQPEKKVATEVDWHLVVCQSSSNEILLQQSDDSYFLRGQWQFPSVLAFKKGKEISSIDGLSECLSKEKRKPDLSHAITHHKIRIYLHHLDGMLEVNDNASWVARDEVADRLVSSALSRAWTIAQKSQATKPT